LTPGQHRPEPGPQRLTPERLTRLTPRLDGAIGRAYPSLDLSE
jgi:hypothetical protein